MLRRVTLVTTDISEELSASIIRVTRISEVVHAILIVTAVKGKYNLDNYTNLVRAVAPTVML
jgi:predicted transglutaminase-like cysteine proteinase